MEHFKFILVFFEGIISFFSPCIIPLIPVYLGILSNSSVDVLKDSDKKFRSTALFKNTILFTLGIATTFFILGSSISVFNKFFTSNKDPIMFFGGILIVILGIFYMGIFNIPFMQREKRLNVEVKDMKPITAYLLGFAFSFAWTPCVGPMLASIIIMASSSTSILGGNMLILIYTLGFIIPFLIISLFYNKLFKIVDKIKSHMVLIKRIGGIILIVVGITMIWSGHYETFKMFNKTTTTQETKTLDKEKDNKDNQEKNEDDNSNYELAMDFELVDNYGKTHTLSEYKGKVVFLNFWATWCPPCKKEMPDIEKIYNYYGKNTKDVIILGVAAPNLGNEGDKEYISKFLKDKGYTFPVLLDETEDKDVFYKYGINAFPTTFIINKEGYVKQYIPGMLTEDIMKQLIEAEK